VRPEAAEFLDEIQKKILRSFAPCYSQSPLQLCLEIYISSNSRNLLHISTAQILYTVKEKGGKPGRNHTPSPMV
jgi:hypothetical protein